MLKKVMLSFIIITPLITFLGGCAKESNPQTAEVDVSLSRAADSIFIGANIITMEPDTPAAEAVAVRGDRIVFVGDRKQALEWRGEATRLVELGEQALLPGFIDAHGHFAFSARTIDFINLSSPPVGPVENIEDMLHLLQDHIDSGQLTEGAWVIGWGYDDSLLAEGRHPTRKDLDHVSTTHPIYLLHVSGHLAAVNSLALDAVGYTAQTANPPGGVIRRWADSNEPNGVLEETAALRFLHERFGEMDAATFARNIAATIDLYLSYGITTIQDGASSKEDILTLRAIADKTPLAADLLMFPLAPRLAEEEFNNWQHDKQYHHGLRVAGVKFVLDGSPQGRTAWLTAPYEALPKGAEPGYLAYPAADIEDYKDKVARLLRRGVPVMVHANGDAAIDAMLDGIETATTTGAMPDHRAVIIHAQLMRQDQLDRAVALNVVPSFFSAHTFFWGDWHRRSFGETRAAGISPAASAWKKGLPFTIHNDTPVVPPDMMRLVWATVNRQTRSGYVLGDNERLSVMQALHAITLGAAYQYFEEDNKGSLKAGKQADMLILAKDPRHVDPGKLADIAVMETIARGKTVYRLH